MGVERHEIAATLIGQDGDVAGQKVGDSQVEAAVCLEVARGDRDGANPGQWDWREDLESPVTVAHETW